MIEAPDRAHDDGHGVGGDAVGLGDPGGRDDVQIRELGQDVDPDAEPGCR